MDTLSSGDAKSAEYNHFSNAFIFDTASCPQESKMVQMRNVVLEMLHDILCDPANTDHVAKFAVTITNRWSLLYLALGMHPRTVLLALRILARILLTQGHGYIAKFRMASDGFLVLARLLPDHWYLTQVHEVAIALLFGIDVSELPISSPARDKTLTSLVSNASAKYFVPDMANVIVALWERAANYKVDQRVSVQSSKYL